MPKKFLILFILIILLTQSVYSDDFDSLIEACEKSNNELIKKYANKENVNRRDKNDWTPFFICAAEGNLEACKMLAAIGADINYRLKNKYSEKTPLIIALEKVLRSEDSPPYNEQNQQRIKTAIYLINRDADFTKPEDQIDLTYISARVYYEPVLSLLLKNGLNINLKDEYGNTAVLTAAKWGNLEMIKFLLKNGADINDRNNLNETAIICNLSSLYSSFEIIKYLYEEGSEIDTENKHGNTALSVFDPGNNSYDILDFLIRNSKNIKVRDKYGNTPLIQAVSFDACTIDLVSYLIKKGIDINAFNNYEATALYIASGTGKQDIIEFLLKNNADPGIKCKNGSTALHEACRHKNEKIIELLLEYGANVNAVDKETGRTPVFIACLNHKGSVEVLIKNGADINLRDNNGETPLYRAVQTKKKEIIELLIQKGADINIKNNNGQTPLDKAIAWNHKEAVEILRTYGAK